MRRQFVRHAALFVALCGSTFASEQQTPAVVSAYGDIIVSPPIAAEAPLQASRPQLPGRLPAELATRAAGDPVSVTVREETWSFGAAGESRVASQVKPVSHLVTDQSPVPAAPCECCSAPIHRAGFFGELLFLRPTNAVTYAIEQNGIGVGASPTGPVGDVQPDFQTGVRLGFQRLSGCEASWRGTFTWLQADDASDLAANGGNVLASRVVHPSTPNASATSIAARAEYEVEFQLADVDYRHAWCVTDWFQLNWVAGGRFGHLDQEFTAFQAIAAANGLTTVQTDVEFDGGGLRLGLDGEVALPSSFSLYGSGIASFLLGQTNASFTQSNQFGGAAVIANRHEDFRIVPMLEVELGLAWRSPGERWRFSGGCQAATWLNTLTTTEYLRGVQTTQLDGLSGSLAFGGFSMRLEWVR